MTTIAELMGRGHAACDALLERAKDAAGDWTRAIVAHGALRHELERHIAMEERVLFPAFEKHSGMSGSGPTQVMRTEHGQLRALLEALSGAVRDRDEKRYLRFADALDGLLRQHNAKEERILYPMLDAALGARAAELFASCEALPHPCLHDSRAA
jgi:iron-sulfur cluster repair protein YtfE (RIC family)